MRRSCYIWVLLLVASSGTLWAQQELANPLIPAKARPRIYVGPVVGYNRSLHSSGFQSIAGDVLCPDFTSGTDNGFYVGFSGEYLLGKPEVSKSSIIARILYNYLPANYVQDGDDLPSLDPNGDVVISSVRHVAEIKYSLIDLEIVYKLNLFNSSFGVVVGPTIGYVLSSKREQRLELVSPDNAVFDRTPPTPPGEYINGDRGIITGRDELPDRSAIRLAVKAGVQYELQAGRILLVPCIYYNFGVTEVSPSANLRVNALQAGIDIRFAL